DRLLGLFLVLVQVLVGAGVEAAAVALDRLANRCGVGGEEEAVEVAVLRVQRELRLGGGPARQSASRRGRGGRLLTAGAAAARQGGTGPMIVTMTFGMFVALAGAAIAGVILRFIPVIFISVIAAVVLGLVDLNDADTRPGLEAFVAVVVPLALICVPALGRT